MCQKRKNGAECTRGTKIKTSASVTLERQNNSL